MTIITWEESEIDPLIDYDYPLLSQEDFSKNLQEKVLEFQKITSLNSAH